MIYERLLRPLFFSLDPERAHEWTLRILSARGAFLRNRSALPPGEKVKAFGLEFRHRVGLAAGLDKNGVALPAWEALGFAFAEIGTVTARAQPGNPRSRVFRYPEQRALINRLGFNNDGANAVAERLARLRERGRWPGIPIGINIGKSRDTALEAAAEDYVSSWGALREFADYIALNVSSPNTPGLRNLQQPEQLDALLRSLAPERNRKPLLVKIAPDLDTSLLDEIVGICHNHDVDGLIATNTTLDHAGIPPRIDQPGGLSGMPLRAKSTAIIRHLAGKTRVPIIGCGGIFDRGSAQEKVEAGARLLQVYTGFIYRGPALLRELTELRATRR